ncbi:MAG: DUF1553 domain-containing protein [Planctomycetaceae bacterium]|nr:DUF1553 domain-containing protein [Planctomycetaceae bacterium]
MKHRLTLPGGWPALLASWITMASAVGGLPGNEEPDFAKVAAILEHHCVRCHNGGAAKGDFSLATAADLFASEFVVPGQPNDSHLIDVITPDGDQPPRMPQNADPVPAEAVSILRDWIAAGARWPEGRELFERSRADATFWSLQPITTTESLNASATTASEIIDQLIDERLAADGLTRNPPADRRTLIRRATYDLTGLPPTPAQTRTFLKDRSPEAWSRLIDRLLASHAYGERWGRHWLDVVRFGESRGFERNVIIHDIWPFRDYVIRALNEDRPFDQLIREHLAGDVLAADDPQSTIGTAFLVAGPYDDVGNQDAAAAAQIRANTLDEVIRATSEAFLGLTVGCARCHNHKFDPITQADYYSLYATFSGVRHGSVEWATTKARQQRTARLQPLQQDQSALEQQKRELLTAILQRGREHLQQHAEHWPRPPVDRRGTEERFSPVTARFVRLVCESQDTNANAATGFTIEEFEVWSAPASPDDDPQNVALASYGSIARGVARRIEDFAGAYGPQLTIDGSTGARFLAASTTLTIELPQPERIDRVLFSSARDEERPEHGLFRFVAEYRIEVSDDGQSWTKVADGSDRQPVNQGPHLDRRLRLLETTDAEQEQIAAIDRRLRQTRQQIAQIPGLPTAWIGRRVASDAAGPFHIFQGGNPQKLGKRIHPASLHVLNPLRQRRPGLTEADLTSGEFYELDAGVPEAERRLALANWIVHPANPLTRRVLANRIWHYHFGTGLVDTPSDFGFMGGRPSHPRLLDVLANQLQTSGWRIKALHRAIMLSETYQQASTFGQEAAKIDADARLLWRFPPRRLSAEEVRDTMLDVAGRLTREPDSGPGFRLYRFLQDNVSTYVPLDQHGPETYRRAVYHQNARSSVVDLMTEFDQPDCSFGTPRRAATTTPLQALTLLNHSFTLDMAGALARRLQAAHPQALTEQINLAFALCYGRPPTEPESESCATFVKSHDLVALCRVLLNTTELISVR